MSKTKKKSKSNILLAVAMVAFLGFGAAFVYYAYEYYRWWSDGRVAQENAEMMADVFQDQIYEIRQIMTEMPAVADRIDDDGEIVTVLFSTDLLDEARALTQNPDIVAYIYIEGTNINNVVVQGADNNFYLYRDMFRNSNSNGAIFLDYRNASDFSDSNTIIYGHNMRNGTMFHDLRFFINPEFTQNHPHIKIITDERVLIYEIFSVFTTHVDFDYIQVEFENQYEFNELLNEIHRRRFFDTSVTPTTDDNILVLSTCTNVDVNTRIVVAGRLAFVFEIEREE